VRRDAFLEAHVLVLCILSIANDLPKIALVVANVDTVQSNSRLRLASNDGANILKSIEGFVGLFCIPYSAYKLPITRFFGFNPEIRVRTQGLLEGFHARYVVLLCIEGGNRPAGSYPMNYEDRRSEIYNLVIVSKR